MEQNQPAATSPQSTQHKPSNAFAVTALVVGIVAFCFGWTAVFGMILGGVAIVFGILALKKKQNKVMGVFGIVLGALALITSLIFTLFAAALINNAPAISNQIQQEAKKQQQTANSKFVITNATYKDGEFTKEVVGEIKNNDTVQRNVSLKATFYKEDGTIVGTASGVVTDLNAGETKTFNLYTTDDVTGYKDLKVQVDSSY